MATSPTERSWCVLKFCGGSTRVPTEIWTSWSSWDVDPKVVWTISLQRMHLSSRIGSLLPKRRSTVRETFTRRPRKSVRRSSRELKIPEPTVRKILRKPLQLHPYKLQLVQNTRIIYTHPVLLGFTLSPTKSNVAIWKPLDHSNSWKEKSEPGWVVNIKYVLVPAGDAAYSK
jgi:hypothetical protein